VCEARADFDDDVAGDDRGEFEGLADDVAVDEKIWPRKRFGEWPSWREQIARGGGRERHGSARRAALVDLVVIEERQEIGAVGEPVAGLVLFEDGRWLRRASRVSRRRRSR